MISHATIALFLLCHGLCLWFLIRHLRQHP